MKNTSTLLSSIAVLELSIIFISSLLFIVWMTVGFELQRAREQAEEVSAKRRSFLRYVFHEASAVSGSSYQGKLMQCSPRCFRYPFGNLYIMQE